MTSKKNLITIIKELYIIEKDLRDFYNDFLKELKDPREKEVIKEIRDDEINHMKIAKELLKIVKGK